MLHAVATLENRASGTRSSLSGRHIVGRSKTCHLHIDEPNVSSLHAEILWYETAWHIQDLGSRNGTFVDGRRLAAGERAALASGAELAFGVPNVRFRLIDDSPPLLMAFDATGEVCVAPDGILCLPSLDEPELTVFLDVRERWVVESVHGTCPIDDQSTVVAGGKPWRVCLPSPADRTHDLGALQSPHLSEIELRFSESLDGEHIVISVVHGKSVQDLEARAHAYLLLSLARVRQNDAKDPGVPKTEQGWVYREDLIKMLNLDPELLNVWIFRARRQLTEAGLRGAAGIIERRAGTHQLRIGTCRTQIHNGGS
jgi:hypothetical protein